MTPAELCTQLDEMGEGLRAGISPAISTRIVAVCDELKELLLAKNESYGNSAADPLRVFSRVTAEEGIRVRIDDKLSRIARGSEFIGDDTLTDLAGYLVLLLAVRRGAQ